MNMKGEKSLRAVSFFAFVGLLLLSCAPALEPAATPKPAATPEAKPAAPTPTPKPAADQPRYGGILTVSTLGDPLSMDIHQEASYLVQNVLECAYNGITRYNPKKPGEIIGDLAETWEASPDGFTWTFRLRKNVKFHDGSPFSAQDVKFSFERMANPPRGILSPRRADLASVSKVEAPDEHTVKFTLKYPSSAFLSVISTGWMVIYSKAFVEAKGHMRHDVLGTGPFRFKGYLTGVSVEHVKNPDYFIPGRPYLDAITFYIIKDAGTRLAAFRTGQVKLTGPHDAGLTPIDAEIVKRTMPQAIVATYPSLTMINVIMNTSLKPWDDIRVRKAVHLAIDRQKAIQVLAQGYGGVGNYFPLEWGLPEEELLKMPGWRQPKDADIGEAKRLIAEAGYHDGFPVKALIRAEKVFEEAAIYVRDQLAKIAIKIELDVREAAVRTDLLNKGAFSFHVTPSSLAIPDPENVARYWMAPVGEDWGMNWQRFRDKDIEELFSKQSRSLDPAERKRIVHQLDRRMIEVAARPVIFWKDFIMGMWPEVKDRSPGVGTYCFNKYQDVWLAK